MDSYNNKSYMDMPYHFIDEVTYERNSYVLGCRRLMGTRNRTTIATVIPEVMATNSINTSKVTHNIVTDNTIVTLANVFELLEQVSRSFKFI